MAEILIERTKGNMWGSFMVELSRRTDFKFSSTGDRLESIKSLEASSPKGAFVFSDDGKSVESLRVRFPRLRLVVVTSHTSILPASDRSMMVHRNSWKRQLVAIIEFLKS